VCRDGLRRAKALGELDLVKGDKKGSCRYIGSTRKARENVRPLLMGVVKNTDSFQKHPVKGQMAMGTK